MINDLDDLDNLKDKNNCVICFNVINEQITFKCGHYFCKDCVDKWIIKNIKNIVIKNNGKCIMKCFLCRGNIKRLSYNNNDIKIKKYINNIILKNIEDRRNIDIESNNDIESNTSNNNYINNNYINNNNNNNNYLNNRKYVEYTCILLTASSTIFGFLYYLENYKRY